MPVEQMGEWVMVLMHNFRGVEIVLVWYLMYNASSIVVRMLWYLISNGDGVVVSETVMWGVQYE